MFFDLFVGNIKAVNPNHTGTKCGAHYSIFLNPGQKAQIRVRLYYENEAPRHEIFEPRDFEFVFQQRRLEADVFYDDVGLLYLHTISLVD